jgi:hypothetical protein
MMRKKEERPKRPRPIPHTTVRVVLPPPIVKIYQSSDIAEAARKK